MLCAVAIIGAGYAAFAGTAKTYNGGNSADVGYITLAGNGDQPSEVWAPFTADVDDNIFSTYSYYTSTGSAPSITITSHMAYYLINTDDNINFVDDNGTPDDDSDDVTTTYINKAVGQKEFILTKATSESISAVTVSAKLTTPASIGNEDFVYIMGVKIGNTEKYNLIGANAMNFEDLAVTFENNAATITVTIYVGYVAEGYIATEFPTGVPDPSTAGGKTQAVHTSDTNAPVGFTGATFAFTVVDAAA